MRWTERQRAMLREMGVQLWSREPAVVTIDPASDVAVRERVEPATTRSAVNPSTNAPMHASTTASTNAPANTSMDAPTSAFVAERSSGAASEAPIARSLVAPMAAADNADADADAAIRPADWLVVGDPLDPADPQQEQLLDNLLRAIDVSRRASSREGRAVFVDDPSRVAGAIAAAAPRCVIALGRGAASALLGRDEPIGAWRGRSHRHGDVPVVVTFALAFLLRHPAEKAKAWIDLCLAVGAAAPPPSA